MNIRPPWTLRIQVGPSFVADIWTGLQQRYYHLQRLLTVSRRTGDRKASVQEPQTNSKHLHYQYVHSFGNYPRHWNELQNINSSSRRHLESKGENWIWNKWAHSAEAIGAIRLVCDEQFDRKMEPLGGRPADYQVVYGILGVYHYTLYIDLYTGFSPYCSFLSPL